MLDFRQPRTRRMYAGLVALFTGVVVVTVGYTLLRLREEEIGNHFKLAALQARALEDYLTQSFHNIDLTLQHAVEAGDLQREPAHIGEKLAAAVRHAPYLRSISLLDGSRRIVASSNPRNVGAQVAGGDFLPPAAPPAETLRLGPPWLGRDFDDGQPTARDRPAAGDALTFLPVLRGLTVGGRHVLLLASVNPDYFLDYLNHQSEPGSTAAQVLRYDGTLLISTREDDTPGARSAFAPTAADVAAAVEYGTRLQETPPGRMAFSAYRASRQFPFLVIAQRDRSGALDEWRSEVRLMLAAVALLLGGILLLAGFFYRGLLRAAREQDAVDRRLRLAAKVFEASAEGILITAADRSIASVNPAFTEITGFGADEVVGRDPRILASGQHDRAFYQGMWQAIESDGVWQGEIINRRKNGVIYPEWLTITRVLDDAGRVLHYVGVFSDITERKASESRVRYLSEHDFLTGLPNRFLFQDRVSQAAIHCLRRGGRLAILFIDLDQFKAVNDTLGHEIGDLLLKEIAERLRAAVRAADTVCRQGGDEFLVLLETIDDAADTAVVAAKLLEQIGQPCLLDGHRVSITPSIGIALYPDDGHDVTTLIRAADMAMYEAKEHGRNTCRFSTSSMNSSSNERLSMEQELRHALGRGELALHYQPLVNLADDAIVGVEALLRWTQPDTGPMSPLKFIPVAEESRYILALGEWVMREACRQAVAWDRAGLPPLSLVINISPLQFAQADFGESVARVLAQTGLAGKRLEFDVAETVVIQQAEHGRNLLAQLRALGVRLTVDDFGISQSSLSRLHKLPVDKLKIDRSLARDVLVDADDATLSTRIVRVAHSIGLRVAVAGIETAEQRDFFRALGCDEAQGFHFSRALPPAELAAAVRQSAQLRRAG